MVCAALTLAPLSRRKRVEVAVQSTRTADLAASESGRFDPLDEAAGVLDPSDTDTAQNAVVPELTPRRNAHERPIDLHQDPRLHGLPGPRDRRGGGGLGYALAGTDGLWSALVGVALAVVFAGITAASMLIAIRFRLAAFFGIVMGAWLLKLVIFVVLLVLVKDQPFVNDVVLFLALVVSIIGTLAIDALVVVRGRLGNVSDAVLPPAPQD